MDVIDQVITNDYAIYNGNSCKVLPELPAESIHLSVYSPPFFTDSETGALYNYSSSDEDLSNARDYDEAFDHYDYIVREIYRLTVPGRMTAVHCSPVPTGNTGKDGYIDFPGDLIRAHTMCRNPNCEASHRRKMNGMCGHGWFEYVAMYDIWKEPLGVRNRLMIKSLAHKTIVDDSSRCSVAAADCLRVFRKKGTNPIPITHPTGLEDYAGEREIPKNVLRYKGWQGSQLENRYSHWIWRQYASAFWDDIRINRVLPYKAEPTKDNPRGLLDTTDERHPHALQLDVIERCLALWSNRGERVLSPFMGVGSEIYGAVRNGRKGIGIELKPSYFGQAVKNVEAALTEGGANIQEGFDFGSEDVELSEVDAA